MPYLSALEVCSRQDAYTNPRYTLPTENRHTSLLFVRMALIRKLSDVEATVSDRMTHTHTRTPRRFAALNGHTVACSELVRNLICAHWEPVNQFQLLTGQSDPPSDVHARPGLINTATSSGGLRSADRMICIGGSLLHVARANNDIF